MCGIMVRFGLPCKSSSDVRCVAKEASAFLLPHRDALERSLGARWPEPVSPRDPVVAIAGALVLVKPRGDGESTAPPHRNTEQRTPRLADSVSPPLPRNPVRSPPVSKPTNPKACTFHSSIVTSSEDHPSSSRRVSSASPPRSSGRHVEPTASRLHHR
jgi:hypothetical protein